MAEERRRSTTASPEAVWAIWSDPATWPTWNPDVAAVDLASPLASGARGTMTTAHGAVGVTVAELDPGRSFVLEAEPLPGAKIAITCAVRPLEGGGADISQAVEAVGRLATMFAGPLLPRVAETFGPALDGLALRAEAVG